MLINILICDDDLSFLSEMKSTLRQTISKSKFSDFEYSIYATDNSAAALKHCIEVDVHIVFLDIDMPRINGFDIATAIKERAKESKVIFISNFDNLVYTSFRYNPFRFIRKEVVYEELLEAFEAAVKEVVINEKYLTLGNKYLKDRIFYSDILYIESKGNCADIITSSGEKYEYRSTMNELQQKLAYYDFVRIHAGFLVSMRKIVIFRSDSIVLKNGKTLNVSRKYRNEARDIYANYLIKERR